MRLIGKRRDYNARTIGERTRIWSARAKFFYKEFGKAQIRDTIFNEIVRNLGSVQNMKVVDLGTGVGQLLKKLYQAKELIGVDFSERMLEYARRNLREWSIKATLVNANLVELPVSKGFEDESFDIVVSSLTFHLLLHKEKESALREAFRILKLGGRIVVGDEMYCLSDVMPHKNVWRKLIMDTFYSYLTPSEQEKRFRHIVEWPVTLKTMLLLMKRAGFRNVEGYQIPQSAVVGIIKGAKQSKTWS